MKKQQGFTLLELMIAVAVVGILTMLAVPAYQGYVQRGARAALQSELISAATAMERRKAQNFTYGGAAAGTTFPAVSPKDAPAGSQKYDITLTYLKSDGTVAGSTDPIAGFEIKAVSTSAFETGKTEALKIDHSGRKCYKPLAASVTDCAYGTDKPW